MSSVIVSLVERILLSEASKENSPPRQFNENAASNLSLASFVTSKCRCSSSRGFSCSCLFLIRERTIPSSQRLCCLANISALLDEASETTPLPGYVSLIEIPRVFLRVASFLILTFALTTLYSKFPSAFHCLSSIYSIASSIS